MYILTDVFTFIELLCTQGVEVARESAFYQLVHNIILYEPSDAQYAVPFYVMFEETDYLDIIVNDYIQFIICTAIPSS